MQDGIAHYERMEILEIFKKHKFSLVIDESTDISVAQILAISVRFLEEQLFNIG